MNKKPNCIVPISGIHNTNHFGDTSLYGKKTVAGLCSGFHTYQLLWTASALTMGVDGIEVFKYNNPAGAGVADWPFDQQAQLILNVAVGGNLGGSVDVAQLPRPFQIAAGSQADWSLSLSRNQRISLEAGR